jgi:Tol biopolymer transport system component
VFARSQDSANGHILVLGDDEIVRAQEFDPGNLKLIGQPVPIAEEVASPGYLSASSEGTLCYRHGDSPQRQLVWLNRKGDRMGTVGETARFAGGFRISPDGQRVAVEITENGNRDIWVLGLANNSRTRLTLDSRADSWPIWSLDGKFVLFRSERVSTQCLEGTSCGDGIYRVPADGSAAAEGLFHSEFVKYPLDWSFDGKYMMFADVRPGSLFDLRLLSIADRKADPWLTTEHNEWFARISPDGRWVAYESNESGSFDLLVRPFTGPTPEGTEPPGSKWRISKNGSRPVWRADSRELFYIAGNRDLMSVKVNLSSGASFDFESPQRLFTLPPVTLFEVAENGSRILAFLPDEKSLPSPITVVLNWEAMLLR